MSTSKKSIDEQENERLFTSQKFSFDRFLELINQRRSSLDRKKFPWFDFNNLHHHSPQDVQLHCIYMMLQHVLWKLADNEHDISQIAFIERGWDMAFQEADNQYWRLGKSEKWEQEADDAIEAMEEQKEKRRKTRRTIRQTLEVEES